METYPVSETFSSLEYRTMGKVPTPGVQSVVHYRQTPQNSLVCHSIFAEYLILNISHFLTLFAFE
jgi:hypothetical protein